MTTLRAKGMADYQVTADDMMWLARAVEKEGKPQDVVAATLINGFCWARSCKNSKQTLATWVRAYAQPVNPRWYLKGDLHLKYAKGVTGAELARLEKLAKERETVHSVRTQFSAGTKAACAAALAGAVKIPGNCIDYAAPTLDSSKRGYTALTPVVKGENRMWTRPGAETWAGYVVDAATEAGKAVATAAPWLVGALVLGAVGFAMWKSA